MPVINILFYLQNWPFLLYIQCIGGLLELFTSLFVFLILDTDLDLRYF